MNLTTIERQQLITAALGNRNVSAVDVRRITLAPSQRTGRHSHPCAVVGYIASGTAFCQIEGESAELLPVGSAFYEPAGRTIADFGNASDITPLTFIAFYLLDGEQELITILEENKEPVMPHEIHWTDAEEIGIQLTAKFPDLDPLTVRFTDLHRYVTELEGFADDPTKSNESRLEAIQMAWHEEYEDTKG